MACAHCWVGGGEYPRDHNHAWYSSGRRRDRATRMVGVSRDRILSWLDLVVLQYSALAPMGSSSGRPSRQVAEVGGRCRINLAQGLDLREDRISNRRVIVSSGTGHRTSLDRSTGLAFNSCYGFHVAANRRAGHFGGWVGFAL